MIPITRPELPAREQYEALLDEIWESRMLSNFGVMAQRLESLTSDYIGVPTSVVASGDIGLMVAIAALDLPRGSACLLPSFTFNSTVNAVLWNGLEPVFVDVDPLTFNVDPEDARAIAVGRDVSLVIATHVFGSPADSSALRSVADSLGARLMFDAAHGYGSRRDGQVVGSLGDVEVFSLSGTKPVTSAEGGLISSADPVLTKRVKLLRGYGFQNDYNSLLVGLNGKMSEFHAALGLLSLARIEQALAVRQGLVNRYRAALAGLAQIRYQEVRSKDRSTYKDFALVFPDERVRETVERSLVAANVQTKRYFRPCHSMDAYRGYATRALPETDRLYARVLCVPLFEALKPEEVDFVSGVIRASLEA